jgi:hypothetical protein
VGARCIVKMKIGTMAGSGISLMEMAMSRKRMVPVEKWKRLAKKLYYEYHKELDKVDCGGSLLEYIRPDLSKKWRLIERLICACKWADTRRAEDVQKT